MAIFNSYVSLPQGRLLGLPHLLHPNSSKPRNDLTPETEKNLGSRTCGSSCGWILKKNPPVSSLPWLGNPWNHRSCWENPVMVDFPARRAMFSSDVFSNVFYCSAMGNSYPNAKILSRNLMSQHNSLLYMDKTWGKLKLLVAATIISGWRLGESEPKPRRITHPTLCLSWPPRSFEAEMMKWFRWTLQFLTNKYQQTLGIWPKLIQSHSNGFKVKGLGPV